MTILWIMFILFLFFFNLSSVRSIFNFFFMWKKKKKKILLSFFLSGDLTWVVRMGDGSVYNTASMCKYIEYRRTLISILWNDIIIFFSVLFVIFMLFCVFTRKYYIVGMFFRSSSFILYSRYSMYENLTWRWM